ncbi:MAG: hypothetical protein HQK58_08300 [Deltaproteobacteria bacterium]|nr:hypothetical protein [Deltaproteobacteria bacterium]
MSKKKSMCEKCYYRGYSKYFCKLHFRKTARGEKESCRMADSYSHLGKTAVIGAGVGAMVTMAGLAAFPLLGLKVILGHALAMKAFTGGGMAGVGINVARMTKGKDTPEIKPTKKRLTLIPTYLKE